MNNQNDQDLIVSKLTEIERRFPVNEWTVNDIKIWPFIRTSLAYSQRYRSTKKSIKVKKSKKLKRLVLWFLNMPITLSRFSSSVKKSNRIFIGAKTHRRLVNEKWENIYFDKAINYYRSLNEDSTMIDYGAYMDKQNIVNSKIAFSIFELYLWIKIKLRFKSRYTIRIHLPKYELFYEFALREFTYSDAIKKPFLKSNLESQLIEFDQRRDFWINKLKNSKVGSAYFLCYYSGLLYPIISACNHLKIKTVDVQHGGMGIGHWSYSSWSIVPKEGYELLPKYFWTWDDGSEQLINQWAKKSNFHQAINQGTPWIENYFDDTIVCERKFILYNMTIDSITPFLAETFRYFIDKGLKIKFRLHPRLTNIRSQVEEDLDKYDLKENAVVEDSNKVSLKQSLAESVAIISGSSGSIIESINLGFKPILLPSIGTGYYQSQIDNDNLFFLQVEDSGQLIKLIENSIQLNYSVSFKKISQSINYLSEFENSIFQL